MALNYCRPSGFLRLILRLLLVRYAITHNVLDIRKMLDPRDPMLGGSIIERRCGIEGKYA